MTVESSSRSGELSSPREFKCSGRVIEAEHLVSPEWFPKPARAEKRGVVEAAVAAVLALILALSHHLLLASVAVGVGVALAILGRTKPALYCRIQSRLRRLGDILFRLLSYLVLAPAFLAGATLVRILLVISGRDPLQRKAGSTLSFWVPAAPGARKEKYARAMFCVEPRQHGGRTWLALVVIALLTFTLAEFGLRAAGFGHPVLYNTDRLIGFYPAPNQHMRRAIDDRLNRLQWHDIRINNYGMRGPDITPSPTPGVLRIFMIGDSTLYGGTYVSNDQLYARRLEALLNRAGLARRVEVVSMSSNHWGPFQELGYVQRFGEFDSEIAIVCLPMTDIFRPFGSLDTIPYMDARHPPKMAMEEILYHLVWRYRAYRLGSPPHTAEYAMAGIQSYAQLAALLKQKGAKEVFFAVLPTIDPAGTDWASSFRDAVAPLIDAVDYPQNLFSGYDPKRVYHDEIHLDAEGHRIYAQHLSDMLLSQSKILAAERAAAAKVR